MISDLNPQTPVDLILEEQQNLTAVERFARRHDAKAPPAQQRHYRDLIPLSAPGPGQQYAFEVDLDRCSGCQACVTACHSLNGLDEDESWRQIGVLYSGETAAPFQATVTMACHHCVDPGCLTGCPVLAYDKDPSTGIVHHLDDQCIGCQYCVMKCPYDVPQYSAKRGIVRKCDMCSSRLSQDEAPACVQACPSQAIRITLVDQAQVLRGHRNGTPAFLPAAPDPRHTAPTTIYRTSRALPQGLLAGNHESISAAHPHLALVHMLVLSQLAVGACLAALSGEFARTLSVVGAASGALAIGLGTFHLGRPTKAWRAFLGWRTSWFSREVMAFAAFIPAAAAAAASFRIAPLSGLQRPLSLLAALFGVLGVACSAMIYADTHREFWNAPRSFGRFFGTTLQLGSALLLAVCAASASAPAGKIEGLCLLTGAVTLIKLAFEHRIFRHLVDRSEMEQTPLNRSARLIADELGLAARFRVFCGVAGGIVLPAFVALGRASGADAAIGPAFAALSLCVLGELLERFLFFAAVAPVKMPGGRSA